MNVVTISATYGAGGGLVGPAVAERLGVPFVDRAIPVVVANDLGIAVDDVLCRDEQVRGWMSRLLSATAPLSAEWIIDPSHLRTTMLSDGQVLRCTEGAIRRAVDADGGVILGRAAAIVLRDHPTAFHVRLDGDPDRRVRQAVDVLGIPEQEARIALARNDKARVAYVRHFYGADPSSAEHYHLVLDSTRVPLDTCTEIIVAAVKASVPH
jgi:cytidylate kinase